MEEEQQQQQKTFTKMLEELKERQWYWGAISPQMATRLLRDRPPGTFLVRDSRSDKSIFTFSFTTSEGIYHTRINCFGGKFCLGGPKSLIRSESLPEFVEMIMRSCEPRNEQQEAAEAQVDGPLRVLMHQSMFIHPSAQQIDIRYPLCRNQFLATLKGACRVAIRRQISDSTQIESLPLPKRLKKYLAASDYLVHF